MVTDVYFLRPDGKMLYVVEEGSGDNLWEEDIEAGYVDYFNSYLYDIEKKIELDGGMWLEKQLIVDRQYTIEELIERMKECDAPNFLEDWKVLDNKEGERMMSEIEEGMFRRLQDDKGRMVGRSFV